MSLHGRLVLPAILSSLAILAACGGTNNPTVNPPPSGSFSNSNLSGNYVFSVTGTVADNVNDFVTIMGVFTADGKGNITGGVIDQNSTVGNGLILDTITSGTYNVGPDGRATGTSTIPTGLIALQTKTSGTFQFAYVLTSSEHGLLTEFENFGSASGTLDLQSAVTQANINGQSYAFNFSGTSGTTGTVICNLNVGTKVVAPYATVGAFTLDSSGNISTGLEDFNNNCNSNGLTNLPVTGGSVTLGTGFGTAKITTGTGTGAITYTFDVFPIDATHLKFIETDTLPILVGDAFTQTSSIPTGNNVYTLAGFDNSVNITGPFTAAGIFHADGGGNILSDSVEDIDDMGAIGAGVSVSGAYTALSGGRAELTLSGFINGNNGFACSSCVFAVYPSTGGLQILEIDDGGTTNGIAYAQTATTLASAEGYGMNLSGVLLSTTGGNSEDDIAEFTNSNGAFTGIIDTNDQGTTSFRNAFSANYSADTTAAGRATVSHTRNAPLMTTYVVDSSTAVAVSADSGFVGLGAFVRQNSSAKSNIVANHLAVLRITPSARARSSASKPQPTRSK